MPSPIGKARTCAGLFHWVWDAKPNIKTRVFPCVTARTADVKGLLEPAITRKTASNALLTAMRKRTLPRGWARDTALSREHFPCPNCLEQGERHSLTYENGLFTCPECGGECDAAELIALYDDIRAGHVSDAEVVGLWIEKLDARRVA